MLQVTTGMKKAHLVSKELGKMLTHEQKALYYRDAKVIDKVLLLNKDGQQVKIDSIRDSKNKLIQRFIYKNDSTCEKRYAYGTSYNAGGFQKFPYREIYSLCKDLQGNITATSNEIFSVKIPSKSFILATLKNVFGLNNNSTNKSVITKTNLNQWDFKDGFARQEASGISLFKTNSPSKGYLCSVVKDANGNIETNSIVSKNLTGAHSQESLNNGYLPMLHYKLNDFKTAVFNHLIKKNDLEGRGLKLEVKSAGAFIRGSFNGKTLKSSPLAHTKGIAVINMGHEVEHARQQKEIELFKRGLLSGERLKKAQLYEKEFKNYIQGKDDKKAYRAQLMEIDARKRGAVEESNFDSLRRVLIKEFSGKNGTLSEKQIEPKRLDT